MSDPIIKSLNRLVKITSVTQKYGINIFKEMKEPDVYYLNNAKLCHSIGYNVGKKMITIPVDYSNNYDENKISYNIEISSTVNYKEWKEFVEKVNLFIVEKMELNGLVKTQLNVKDLMVREKNIITNIKLLKFTTVLVHDSNVIGCANDDFYYYFECNVPQDEAIKYLVRGYNVFIGEPNIKKLLYHPNVINSTVTNFITTTVNKYKYTGHIQEILYKRRLYNLFCVHLFSYFDKYKNIKIREDIKNGKNVKLSDADKEKLEEIDDIDDHIFEFDREQYAQIDAITSKADFIKFLKPFLPEILVENAPKFNKPIDYTFRICNESLDFCEKKKLKISSEDLRYMIDTLYKDLMNPMKKKYILASNLRLNIQSQFNFSIEPHEQLYITNSSF
jgi:hypothetical protein